MQYQITDHETGNMYVFNLTEEEYLRASTDIVYCTQLLEKAKETEKENIVHQDAQSDNEIYNDNFRWADEPTRLLLATYKQHENLLHTGKLSVKKFWEMVSNKLKEKAYDVTGQQCKSKINGLKKTYKNVKDYNNKSGNNKRTWLYFEIMDEMFGQKPWVTPILTLDSSNKNILSPASPTSSNSSNISGNTYNEISSSLQSSKSSRKRQKLTQDTTLKKLLAIMEENKEERKKMHNETVERQDRMLNILEKIVNK